ncbi:alkaline phosphatase [Agromyces larvae]|uniref:Alkaline phosphatase n=1 Tax=Agromyces larvae TaxID=2929802 RepID=A0ABY4C539_9MICO|nr:alkaline phosphatase [Agromyces larvae]UOE45542.1 alkaline phosphatase [Agromyces larvae]
MPTLTSPRAGRAAAVAAAALVAASAVLVPQTAFASVDEPGGAQRHPGDATDDLRASIVDGPARNVILLIGDGMGDSEITVARNYAYGAAGQLPGIDALPLTGQYTTYSLFKDGANAGKPDYVPDSAATGTAWSTGVKTYDNAVGVDIHGTPHDTLIELAKANGLRTGNVTTSEIQDATPAVQVAHVAARSCYGPDSASCGTDALEQGGLGSISEQLLDTRPDVTLGGGSASFTQTAKAGQWQGETLFDQAVDRGYQVVGDADGLDAVTAADQNAPLLGLFTPGNFPTRYAETVATAGGADGEAVTCEPNADRLDTRLSLASLTEKAIGLLDDPSSDRGFFLQVEGASIDKRDHSADACGQIGETVDLDEAVQVALEFARTDGETLVIVTADHAHTSQIVDSTPPGLSIRLRTVDGTDMLVSYGTSPAGGSQQHTGAQLRVAGYGPGAANLVGLTDQTDTHYTIAEALGLSRDRAALSAGATVTLPKSSFEPGEEFEVTLGGFAGDRQVGAVLASDPVDLGRTDVLSGTATITATAPTEEGAHTLTVTGAQSGVEVVVPFDVAAGGEPGGPVTGGPGAGAGAGGGPGGGSSAAGWVDGLASTGAAVAPWLAAALLLAGAGTVLVLRRRRRAASARIPAGMVSGH